MRILGFDFSVKKNSVSAKIENTPSKGKQNPSVLKIVENFKDASRKDIDKWRKALLAAQNIDDPKFNLYYDLLDDLMTDGHLQSQIQIRKLSTLNTDFQIINRKTSVINEELSFIVQQQWFYELLNTCLDSIITGTKLVEFSNFQNEKVSFNIIPSRNVVSTRGKVFPDVQKPDFILYQDDIFKPWIFQIGKEGELGVINNIIPNLIWKRNVTQAWAEFCEKFGLPLITATTNTADAKVIDNVHEMLLSLGEASVGTFPPGTDIKFQEANRTDAYNVYMQFLQINTNEISKILVGSTMLSDQGTNRSQTEVHERSLDNKIAQADKKLIQYIVNDQLFPLLNLQGYNIGEDDIFEFKTAEQEIDLPQLWNITNGLLNSGYEVEQEWISKTFNIPIEGKKKIKPIPNITAHYAPTKPDRYDFACTCGNHLQAISQPGSDKIRQFTDDLADYIFNGKDTLGIEGGLISEEANTLLSALRSKFKTGNEFESEHLRTLQMMEYNLFDFAASKTEARMASMKELLIDYDKKEIRDFPSFRVKCDELMQDYNANWLEAEYNLSVAVGQNSSRYLDFMAEKDSVTHLVKYQTVGDDKVRPTHKVLEGKIFSLDDKEAMDLFPPNGYGCRCEMVQYLGSSKPESGNKLKAMMYQADPKYKDSQFEINRGNLKQVFTKKQFYSDIKKLPEKINEMTFDKYQLGTWDSFKGSLKKIVYDKTITAENVKELFKAVKDKDYMGFTDYLGRKITISEKVFNKHTDGKIKKYLTPEESRHQLFPHIKGILNSPDEVWYYKKEHGEGYQSRYIKFYKDEVIIIEAEIDSLHNLSIKTWYPLKKDEKEIRLGLKIK